MVRPVGQPDCLSHRSEKFLILKFQTFQLLNQPFSNLRRLQVIGLHFPAGAVLAGMMGVVVQRIMRRHARGGKGWTVQKALCLKLMKEKEMELTSHIEECGTYRSGYFFRSEFEACTCKQDKPFCTTQFRHELGHSAVRYRSRCSQRKGFG